MEIGKPKSFNINVNKKKKSVKLHYKENMYGTKAIRLLKKYNYHTYFDDNYSFTHANYEVIYATIDDEPVGFVSFWIAPAERKAAITGVWVEPAWRYSAIKVSIYDKLIKELIEHLQGSKPIQLISGTRNSNTSVQKAFERQGRPASGFESSLTIE